MKRWCHSKLKHLSESVSTRICYEYSICMYVCMTVCMWKVNIKKKHKNTVRKRETKAAASASD